MTRFQRFVLVAGWIVAAKARGYPKTHLSAPVGSDLGRALDGRSACKHAAYGAVRRFRIASSVAGLLLTGGRIYTGDDATGILIDRAIDRIRRLVPPATPADIDRAAADELISRRGAASEPHFALARRGARFPMRPRAPARRFLRCRPTPSLM